MLDLLLEKKFNTIGYTIYLLVYLGEITKDVDKYNKIYKISTKMRNYLTL